MRNTGADVVAVRIARLAPAALPVVVFGLLGWGTMVGCAAGGGGAPAGTGAANGSGGTGSGGRVAGSGGGGLAGVSGAGTGGRDSTGGATGGAGDSGSGGTSATGGLSGTGGSRGTDGSGGATVGSGGSGSGGSGGGGSGSGGAGGGARGCAASGLLFCDDFESTEAGAVPGAPRWTTAFNGMATITVDGTTPAHSGSRSVHVKTAGSYQAFLVLSNAVTFPARTYFRTFIRLGAPMTGGHNTYFKSGAAATSSSDHETRVGVMNAMLMINQPAGDRGALSNQKYYTDGNKPGVVFAPQTWVCVEVLADPPHSEIDVWVDGKEVPDLHLTDWQQDPVQALRFGFEKYAGPDADIWYDDIAVSAQPIGCN